MKCRGQVKLAQRRTKSERLLGIPPDTCTSGSLHEHITASSCLSLHQCQLMPSGTVKCETRCNRGPQRIMQNIVGCFQLCLNSFICFFRVRHSANSAPRGICPPSWAEAGSRSCSRTGICPPTGDIVTTNLSLSWSL